MINYPDHVDSNDAFIIGLSVGLKFAISWGFIEIPPGQTARLVNWRFEGNESVGMPGLVVIEDASGELAPGIALDGCTFENNDLHVVDTILDLIDVALDES